MTLGHEVATSSGNFLPFSTNPGASVFTITHEQCPWWAFPYTVMNEGSVATITVTLTGARWWVRHRGQKYLASKRQRPIEIERIKI